MDGIDSREVAEAVRALGTEVTAEQVAEHLGYPLEVAASALEAACDAGDLVRARADETAPWVFTHREDVD